MPVLEALKAFNYDHVRLQRGDKFKCARKHVPIVLAAKLAKVPEDMVHTPTGIEPDFPVILNKTTGKPATYSTRHMEADLPVYSDYTKARLQEMLTDKKVEWKPWENKAVLVERLKAQK